MISPGSPGPAPASQTQPVLEGGQAQRVGKRSTPFCGERRRACSAHLHKLRCGQIISHSVNVREPSQPKAASRVEYFLDGCTACGRTGPNRRPTQPASRSMSEKPRQRPEAQHLRLRERAARHRATAFANTMRAGCSARRSIFSACRRWASGSAPISTRSASSRSVVDRPRLPLLFALDQAGADPRPDERRLRGASISVSRSRRSPISRSSRSIVRRRDGDGEPQRERLDRREDGRAAAARPSGPTK